MNEFIKKLIERLEEKLVDCFKNMNLVKDEDGTVAGHIYDEYFNKSIAYEDAIEIVNQAAEEYGDGWIPCSERLPEERDSIFAKLKGTDKWSDAMFEKVSDDVNVTVEFEDGTKKTMTSHTIDGKWKNEFKIVKSKVIAWQPLPEPYKQKEE